MVIVTVTAKDEQGKNHTLYEGRGANLVPLHYQAMLELYPACKSMKYTEVTYKNTKEENTQ